MAEVHEQIQKPKLLVGEGDEEVQFFTALLRSLGLAEIQVEKSRGKEGLSGYLKLLPLRPGFQLVNSLGVTRDANGSAEDAMKSVRGALKVAGLPDPDDNANRPRVSVWILPDNRSPGMLEDLCLSAVNDDPAFPCVDEFLRCVEAKTSRKPEPASKAKTYAWLASQNQPNRRLGEAAQAGVLPWNHAAFDNLKRFLSAL